MRVENSSQHVSDWGIEFQLGSPPERSGKLWLITCNAAKRPVEALAGCVFRPDSLRQPGTKSPKKSVEHILYPEFRSVVVQSINFDGAYSLSLHEGGVRRVPHPLLHFA